MANFEHNKENARGDSFFVRAVDGNRPGFLARTIGHFDDRPHARNKTGGLPHGIRIGGGERELEKLGTYVEQERQGREAVVKQETMRTGEPTNGNVLADKLHLRYSCPQKVARNASDSKSKTPVTGRKLGA